MVGMKGLEPSRLTALVPKTSVYTNFTTSPRRNRRAGFCKRKFSLTFSLRSFPPYKFAKYCTAEFYKFGKLRQVYFTVFCAKKLFI
jgi:hypothetical protein